MHLGLSDDEFWDLTSREFHALMDARLHDDLTNYRAALPAAATYNANPYLKVKKPVKPLDFFERRQGEIMTADRLITAFQSLTTPKKVKA